jgi:hypothetical protein
MPTQSLLRSQWDLIIVDEAHKMSAASADKKTLAYELGESLSSMTDHFLLMTATPHKGDPKHFCLFLELLDKDVYGDVKSLEEAMRRNSAPFYLRRTKEALITFPDPNTPACPAGRSTRRSRYAGKLRQGRKPDGMSWSVSPHGETVSASGPATRRAALFVVSSMSSCPSIRTSSLGLALRVPSP